MTNAKEAAERWRSIAVWPPEVSCGSERNESYDTHSTKEAAEAVCRGLMREGLGGDRAIFPLSVRVEPLTSEANRE